MKRVGHVDQIPFLSGTTDKREIAHAPKGSNGIGRV